MTALVVFLVLQATSIERAEAHLENERFDSALAELRLADRNDPRFGAIRDGAVKGVARDLQRADGYEVALRYLEERLESRAIIDHYAETCIWAGELDRGFARIARLTGPLAKSGRFAEMQLHWERLDFATMEERARAWGWDDWADYAREQKERRERFADRAARGWWVAAIAALLMGGMCFWIGRLRPIPERAAPRNRVSPPGAK